jgi:hypothetical protein
MAISDTDRRLSEAYASGDLIIFAGPDVSRAAGLPCDAELAQKLLAEHEPGNREEIERLLAAGLPNVALDHLHRQLGGRFNRSVQSALDDLDQMAELPRAIARLRDGLCAVYTTNLDRLLERAFAGAWPNISSASDLGQRCCVIFKVRGTIQRPATWLLTERQLDDELLGSSPTREALRSAYAVRRMLFVGFDQRCPLLNKILQSVTTGRAQVPDHHIVLDSCDPTRRADLEGRGVAVIVGPAADVLGRLAGVQRVHSSPTLAVPSCPYPGLSPFDLDMRAVFFGRETEVSEATARLGCADENQHRRHWLSIEGPSGVGKSSFALAGVVPAIQRGFAPGTPQHWRLALMRPGKRPIATLAAATAMQFGLDPVLLETRIRTDPACFADELAQRLPPGQGFLLVIDQLEELFTESTRDERELLTLALARSIQLGALYLVTTMRSDFVSTLQHAAGPLAVLRNRSIFATHYELPAISRLGLRDAIMRPAALAGVSVSAELAEWILAEFDQEDSGRSRPSGEVANTGFSTTHPPEVRMPNSSLPLVAHAIWKLWERRKQGDLCIGDCDAIGGLDGALDASADETLAVFDAKERAFARDLLLELVNVERNAPDTRHSLSRTNAVDIAGGGALGERVVMQLSSPKAKSLPVIVVDSLGNVDLVHEALLRHWRVLGRWIAESRERLRWAPELRWRAREWDEAGQPWRHLPRGHDADNLLQVRAGNKAQRDYQRALRRARVRQVGLRIATMMLIGVLAATQLLAACARLRVSGDKSRSIEADRQALQNELTEQQYASELIAAGEIERAEQVLIGQHVRQLRLGNAKSPLIVENRRYLANLGGPLGHSCERRTEQFSELVGLAAEVHGSWSEKYGRALHDAAGDAADCEDYELARAYARRCLVVRILLRDPKLDSALLMSSGIEYESGSDLEGALVLAQRGLVVADDLETRAELDHMLACIRIRQADMLAGPQAFDLYKFALEDLALALDSNTTSARKTFFKLSEGYVHAKLGDHEAAIDAYEEALSQAESNFSGEQLRLHWQMYLLALCDDGQRGAAEHKLSRLRDKRPAEDQPIIDDLAQIVAETRLGDGL